MNTDTAVRPEVTMLDIDPAPSYPLAPAQERALAAQPLTGPLSSALDLLRAGVSIEDMKGLLAIQKEHEANEARKAFVSDMAEYKRNPPTILKDKMVWFESAKGVTSYDHASLGHVCDEVITTAAQHGFSHRWVPSTDGAQQVITCVITHRLGHFEETPLRGPSDTTGNKNLLQAEQSTRTFLQRYSLLLAFGFAAKDQPDDDGAAARALEPAATEPAVEGDPTENDLTREWCNKVNACKSLDTMRMIRREANKAFVAAQDPGRWIFFRNWVDSKIADMGGQAG